MPDFPLGQTNPSVSEPLNHQPKVAIIGLGYVGLPLALAFAKHFPTLGFDVNQGRINALAEGHDETLEVDSQSLKQSTAVFSSNIESLAECNFYIVCVPTPVDRFKQPDLSPLISACQTVGKVLCGGDMVIFESTVYPGASEEACVPILEQASGLKLNQDFCIGYSPERINPGDKVHGVEQIVKVTSGSTEQAAEYIDAIYRTVITAGTFKAASVRVAEAAKVIENTQRDVNIALMNELALIFHKLGIDTSDVLAAAGTKWNFLPFRPGLVGGHCIGVDPYYLTQKAMEVGHHPEVILAGRRLNDDLPDYIARQFVLSLAQKKLPVVDARVLVMGLTFKENCPDTRNSKAIELIAKLQGFGMQVDCFDPMADAEDVSNYHGIQLVDSPRSKTYHGVILAVAHQDFVTMDSADLRGLCQETAVIYDLKHVLPREVVDFRL